MATLGQAFIEVHADTKPFAKELGKQLRTILKAAEPQIRRDAEGIGKALGDGATARVKTEGTRIGRTLSENVEKGWVARSDALFKKFSEPFERLARGNFLPTRVIGGLVVGLTRAAHGIVKALAPVVTIFKELAKIGFAGAKMIFEFGKVVLGFAGDVEGAAATAGESLGKLGTAIATAAINAASSLPQLAAMAVAFILLAGAAGAALAALTLVAAVFYDLIGFAVLLPAALSVLLAIILPLVVGFHNLGDAIGLVFEKDPDKLAAGLKKLSPPMRDLVTALRSVAPILGQIEKQTQEALIRPILEVLAPAIKDLGPTLAKGFEAVAGSAGRFIRDLITLLDSPVFKQLITDLFPATARIITALSGPALRLIEAFAAAADKMLPDIERLAGKFGDLIVQFATWITTSVEDGSFQTFLADALASLTAIWNLVQALIVLFGDLFKKVNGDGRKFLDIITQAITDFTTWLDSPDGLQALQGMVDLAKTFGIAFAAALIVLGAIFSLIGKIDHAVRRVVEALNALSGGVNAVGGKLGTGGLKTATQYATGGFTNDQGVTPAILHPQEVVIPLTKPARAQQLMTEAGLWNTGSQGQQINVYVGGRQLDEIIDYHVQRGNRANAATLSSGPRR